MKRIYFLCALLGVTGWGFGQGGPDTPTCEFCVHLTDATCTATANCDESIDCTTTNFSVPCDETYTLRSEIACASGSYCKYCIACARIKLATTTIATAHNGCNEFDCDGTANVALQSGKTYTLVVCQRICPEANCENCASCTARAEVKFLGSACPNW
jgi:hypothetical protein